jgi:hypothetical protein
MVGAVRPSLALIDEKKAPIPCDAFGNNVAFSCPEYPDRIEETITGDELVTNGD